jgi:hypothetical protein
MLRKTQELAIQRALMGGIATAVAQEAHWPVLVVGRETCRTRIVPTRSAA